jgi:hypothetical protein
VTKLNERFVNKLLTKPAFCFTTDTDWAPESMIQSMLDVFDDNGIPLTPFITHDSKMIDARYKGPKKRYVGLHPNFLGRPACDTVFAEVVSDVVKLWPTAKSFRCHGYFDNSAVSREFYARGFKYDSNLGLHLQSRIVPLQHSSGLLRFPVFLEDDCYAKREGVWNVSHILHVLRTPGLKIFNFHPVHMCLNTPNMDYYERIRRDVTEDWERLRHRGKGTCTFLLELLRSVQRKPGLGVFFLDDLYSLAADTAR